MVKISKIDSMIIYMQNRIWSYTDLMHMYMSRIDQSHSMFWNKRFSAQLKRAMDLGLVVRFERGRYVVTKKGIKHVQSLLYTSGE